MCTIRSQAKARSRSPIGGGTYARHLKEGVAYGMMFPGELELEHQANESIDVANFVKAARIYAYAIVALCA